MSDLPEGYWAELGFRLESLPVVYLNHRDNERLVYARFPTGDQGESLRALDLRDPMMVGWLLGLVREAWDRPHLRTLWTAMGWMLVEMPVNASVHCLDDVEPLYLARVREVEWQTEAEALVVALEQAPVVIHIPPQHPMPTGHEFTLHGIDPDGNPQRETLTMPESGEVRSALTWGDVPDIAHLSLYSVSVSPDCTFSIGDVEWPLADYGLVIPADSC